MITKYRYRHMVALQKGGQCKKNMGNHFSSFLAPKYCGFLKKGSSLLINVKNLHFCPKNISKKRSSLSIEYLHYYSCLLKVMVQTKGATLMVLLCRNIAIFCLKGDIFWRFFRWARCGRCVCTVLKLLLSTGAIIKCIF